MCSGECLLVSCCVCCCRLFLQTAQRVPAQHGEIAAAGLWSGGITCESLPVVPGFSWAAGRKKKKKCLLVKRQRQGQGWRARKSFPHWSWESEKGKRLFTEVSATLGNSGGGDIAQRSHQIDAVCCLMVLTSSSALCREPSARWEPDGSRTHADTGMQQLVRVLQAPLCAQTVLDLPLHHHYIPLPACLLKPASSCCYQQFASGSVPSVRVSSHSTVILPLE